MIIKASGPGNGIRRGSPCRFRRRFEAISLRCRWSNTDGETPMPELPEVETIVRGLRRPLRGRSGSCGPASGRPRSTGGGASAWARSRAARSRASSASERMRYSVSIRPRIMVVNLGMTGQLLLHPSCELRPRSAPEDTSTAGFVLDDGSELRYYDLRRFGFIFVTPLATCSRAPRIGPDPFDADPRDLAKKLSRPARRRSSRCFSISESSPVSGTSTPTKRSSTRASIRGHRAAGPRARREIFCSPRARFLTRAIAHGGSTIRDYRRPDGSRGGFQDLHAVYGREGEPCVRCGDADPQDRPRRTRNALLSGVSDLRCAGRASVDGPLFRRWAGTDDAPARTVFNAPAARDAGRWRHGAPRRRGCTPSPSGRSRARGRSRATTPLR